MVFGSGLITANTEWRQLNNDGFTRTDAIGSVLYERSLGSGTGYGEINSVWSEFSTLSGSKTIDIFSLSTTLYDASASFSWSGGNIKACQIAQSGSGAMTVALPFPNYSGIVQIPTSGSLLISNMEGWTVGSTNRNIVLTHPTTTAYQISLVGSL